MVRIFILCIGVLGLFSCTSDSALERVLKASGNNRQELERVLHHYAHDGQKYRAACFLIENMPRKGSILYQGKWYDKKVEADLLTIKADFLIENIDLAFEVWQKYPWCRHLTELEFFKMVLPYRLKNEPLEDWRSFYYNKYRAVADSLAGAGATMKEVVFFFNGRYGKRYTHDADSIPGDWSYRLMEKVGGGTCDRLALNAVQVMRSIGIPLNLDELPYHGKVNGGHAYNSFTDEQGMFHYFSPYEREPERNRWVAPLVRRINYGIPRYEDVTSSYYGVADVRLDVPALSVATYNRGSLKIVKQGGAEAGGTLFKDLSLGLLYFPVDASGSPCGVSPFILDMDGVPQFIASPDVASPVMLNGIRTYDVKRVLPLGDEVYTLRGWDNGWHDLATAVSSDSVSLDFGNVPDYRLFVVYGNTTMGRMQRPFVMVGDSIAYY